MADLAGRRLTLAACGILLLAASLVGGLAGISTAGAISSAGSTSRAAAAPAVVAAASGATASLTGGVTCTASSGRVAVAVVVMFGENDQPSPRCGDVAPGANGMDALRSTGFTLRLDAGFVCAINAVPETGCANGGGFDGTYWRYFRALPGGTWEYSRTGAGFPLKTSGGCAIEGWIWSGAQKVTPPVVPVGSIACSHTPPPTTPPVPTTNVPPVTSAPSTPAIPSDGGGSPSSSGVGSGGNGGSGPTPGVPGAGPSVTSVPTEVASGGDNGSVEGSVDSGSEPTGTVDPGRADVDSVHGDRGESSRNNSKRDEVASGTVAGAAVPNAGGGSPVGLIVALCLVGVLGAGTLFLRQHRRSSSPNP